MAISTQVKVALITGTLAIIATVLGGLLNPSWWRKETHSPNSGFAIAGTVIDTISNTGVGQASISIVGPIGGFGNGRQRKFSY